MEKKPNTQTNKEKKIKKQNKTKQEFFLNKLEALL
jgi:hypothetical protein